ncbi:hypothetical protein E4U16_003593, partial [Claviceps sp. LM84 group G4]
MPQLIAAAVAVRAVYIGGNSHGQHYVTDSPLSFAGIIPSSMQSVKCPRLRQ